MMKYENDCVGCDTYCMNCGRKSVPHFYCDECGEEETLYYYDSQELCLDCIRRQLEVVEGSEC